MIVTEIFSSLQGEGRFVGVPSLFIRFFGCNFRCPKFNNGGILEKNYNKDVKKFIDLLNNLEIKEFEEYFKFIVETGCDSYYSVYPEFKKYFKNYTYNELKEIVDEAIKKGYDIVITGGEPLIYRKNNDFLNLINYIIEKGVRLTIETNGYYDLIFLKEIHYSISPKLFSSGNFLKNNEEKYFEYLDRICENFSKVSDNSWLKFVITSSYEDDLKDIIRIEKKLENEYNIKMKDKIYLMPCGNNLESYKLLRRSVYDICMELGYNYSPRLHLDLKIK